MVTINHCRSKDTPTTSRCTNQAHREISLISPANISFFPWLSGLLFVDFFFCTKCKINPIKFSKSKSVIVKYVNCGLHSEWDVQRVSGWMKSNALHAYFHVFILWFIGFSCFFLPFTQNGHYECVCTVGSFQMQVVAGNTCTFSVKKLLTELRVQSDHLLCWSQRETVSLFEVNNGFVALSMGLPSFSRGDKVT